MFFYKKIKLVQKSIFLSILSTALLLKEEEIYIPLYSTHYIFRVTIALFRHTVDYVGIVLSTFILENENISIGIALY